MRPPDPKPSSIDRKLQDATTLATRLAYEAKRVENARRQLLVALDPIL